MKQSHRSLKVLGTSRTLPTIDTQAYDPEVSKVGSIKASKAPSLNPYANIMQLSNDRNRVQRDFFKRMTPRESSRELSLKVQPTLTSQSNSSRAKQTKVLNYIITRAKYDEKKLNSDLFKALK